MAIDVGKKRNGIAVTDPLRIVAKGIVTLPPEEVIPFLQTYFTKEEVDKVLIGYPLNNEGQPTDATAHVTHFIARFKKVFPYKELELVDELFSSKRAAQALVQSGIKKKDRQRKDLLDQMSAALFLQDYLQNL